MRGGVVVYVNNVSSGNELTYKFTTVQESMSACLLVWATSKKAFNFIKTLKSIEFVVKEDENVLTLTNRKIMQSVVFFFFKRLVLVERK